MMRRRRFIQIVAGSALGGGLFTLHDSRQRVSWHGTAFGAQTSITIAGDQARAAAVQNALQQEILRLEGVFSLFLPTSEISALNRNRQLDHPSSDLVSLLQTSKRIWRATEGKFDPSIGARWQHIYQQKPGPLPKVSFASVNFSKHAIKLEDDEISLSLNGIAQGYASDRVADLLKQYGFTRILVNVGEYVAGAGAWAVAIAQADARLLTKITLTDNALASSSPSALHLPQGQSHILDPANTTQALWHNVAVQAQTATIADGFSTAMVLMDKEAISQLVKSEPAIESVYLQDADGQQFTI